MPKGTIRRLITERGFGFIRTAEGRDLFFHRSQLQGVDYGSLREGQEIEFEVGKGRDGRSQAFNVKLPQPKDEHS
jgi:CspA family cold shock protein